MDASAPDSGETQNRDAGVSFPRCGVWDGGGVDFCDAVQGYVLREHSCHGACVGYPDSQPGVFGKLADCLRCGCDTTKLNGWPGPAPGPDSECGELVAVTSAAITDEAFPGFDANCRAINNGEYECIMWSGSLGQSGFARACATTMIPSVVRIECRSVVHP